MEVVPWRHNLGFAFNRNTWHEILQCADEFCSYDDYNWDFTLRHISQQCLQKKLITMVAQKARAFHFGIWYVLKKALIQIENPFLMFLFLNLFQWFPYER